MFFFWYLTRCRVVTADIIFIGRTNPWFLLVIPPLGILFFVIERYFIAANRQVTFET